MKTYEKGTIHVRFNTDKVSGHQKATLTVKIGGQFQGYATLQVRGFIRNDITFEPSSVRFDTVPLGEEREKKVKVVFTGSNPFWKIQEAQCANPNISVTIGKLKPMRNRIEIDLLVKLHKDAAPGPITDKIFLTTSDASVNHIPLQVEGEIRAAVFVKPDFLSLGPVQEGANLIRTFVISGNQPFTIRNVKSNDKAIDVSVNEKLFQTEPSTRFILPVNFTVKEVKERKSVRETIQFETDNPQSPTLEVQIFAVLKPN